jgi:hypothetical protein
MMALTTSLKKETIDGLRHHLTLLLEADEPEAFLSSLHRIIEHKIKMLMCNVENYDEVRDWSIILEALEKMRRES